MTEFFARIQRLDRYCRWTFATALMSQDKCAWQRCSRQEFCDQISLQRLQCWVDLTTNQCFFFIFCTPSYISLVHHFWVRFLCMSPDSLLEERCVYTCISLHHASSDAHVIGWQTPSMHHSPSLCVTPYMVVNTH